MSITFGTLYSGSGGNCAVFSDGVDTILIDAGWNQKHLLESLAFAGIDPDNIGGIFITHSHGDHIGALPVFLKHHNIPVHATDCTCGEIGCGCISAALCRHPRVFTEKVGAITVSSYPTSHDVESVGYVIEYNGRKFGYATDLGIFTDEIAENLAGSECVILESNHDPDMLRDGPYNIDLQKRIRSNYGHLSNGQSAEALLKLISTGTKRFILAHVSEINNQPNLVLNTARKALTDAGYTALPAFNQLGDREIGLCVASQEDSALLRL